MDWADRIGRRIKLRDLHVLLAVAEYGSMAKAAAHLAISHPVVSKTISDLEQNLGLPLFDRHSQGVELTPYGRALLKCGVTVFDEMRQGLKHVQFLATPDSGELRIGCAEILTGGLLPAVAQRLSNKYPKIHLKVIVANPALMQFQELRERNVELMMGRLSVPLMPEDLVADILFDEPSVVVAGVRSQWARRRRIKFADLIGGPWILPPYDSAPGSHVTEIFRAANLEPPAPNIATLSVQLTTTLVAAGHYLGLLPRSVVQFSALRRALKILRVTVPVRRTAVGILTVKERTLDPLAKLFIECARETVKSKDA